MDYEKPAFVEIKMDAEIGSYQADYDPTVEPAEESPPVLRDGESAPG